MTTNPLSAFSNVKTEESAQNTPNQETPQMPLNQESVNDQITEDPTVNAIQNVIAETEQSQPNTNVSQILEEPVKPIVPENMNLIASLTPGAFDAFVKAIEVLQDSTAVEIRDSQICQRLKQGIAILMTDISSLFENQTVSFTILNPKKYIRFFKNLRGNNHVAILDDVSQQRYIFTNKSIKLFVPKPIEETLDSVTIPDLSSSTQVGTTITIDKEVSNQIKGIASGSDSVELIVHENVIKGIYIPETAVYLFEQYADQNIDETNADKLLKAYSLLSVPAEEYKISVYATSDTFHLIQECNTGVITMNILEGLTLVTDEILI